MTRLLPLWRDLDAHRSWLRDEANALFRFYEARSVDPVGGFFVLDDSGRPLIEESSRPLWLTTRMVHGFAIGMLLGRPGAADLVDHGMRALREKHRDQTKGGYFWSFDANGPREREKTAYGHAFVLLAASSAKCVGHPEADALLADVAEVMERRFWDDAAGASREDFHEDWSEVAAYRGQNSNMHLTEALMAAFEATGERSFLGKAERIADLIIRRHAVSADGRVPEHYRADWSVDPDYRGSDVFRPAGYTPGHALEWTRLLLQLWELGGRKLDWAPRAARRLFDQAITQGWEKTKGGFVYTTDAAGAPLLRARLWWPACEGIGAAHFLGDETWYRRIWDFCARHFIDADHGGWFPELDDELKPHRGLFAGKPDVYHALQACLIPLYPATASLTRAIASSKGA